MVKYGEKHTRPLGLLETHTCAGNFFPNVLYAPGWMSISPSDIARNTPYNCLFSNSKRNSVIPFLTLNTKSDILYGSPNNFLSKHSFFVSVFDKNIAPHSGIFPGTFSPLYFISAVTSVNCQYIQTNGSTTTCQACRVIREKKSSKKTKS